MAKGLPAWQEGFFAVMERNAIHVSDFFSLPSDQVVEIGRQVFDLGREIGGQAVGFHAQMPIPCPIIRVTEARNAPMKIEPLSVPELDSVQDDVEQQGSPP